MFKLFFSCWLILLITANYYLSEVDGASDCKFEGCRCDKVATINRMNIECVIEDESPKPALNYFPKQVDDPNFNDSTIISQLYIYGYNFETIPDFAFENLKIENIYLGSNNMKRVSENSFAKAISIKSLTILDTQLEKLEPNSLSSLIFLNDLDLSSCQIDDAKFIEYMKEISNIPNLINLDLSSNNLTSLGKDQFSNLRYLKSLNVQYNKISRIDANAFTNNTNLNSIDMRSNQLTDLNEILVALRNSTLMSELKLSFNKISSLASDVILDQLTTLDLRSNNIKAFDSASITGLTKVRFLSLSDNQIDTIDSDRLNQMTNLRELKLDKNQLNQTPSILNLTHITLLSLANQNGQLTRLDDHAFEKKEVLYNLNVDLDLNAIVAYGDKAFCSRYTTRSPVTKYKLSYNSMKFFNKCFLNQMSNTNLVVELEVGKQEGQTDYSDVCNCLLLKFARSLNVNMTGACLGYIDSCSSSDSLVNDCLDTQQYVCVASNITTTPLLTTTTTTTSGAFDSKFNHLKNSIMISINMILLFQIVFFFF